MPKEVYKRIIPSNLKGKKIDLKTKLKISNTLKGRLLSEETKKKMSIFRKGKIPKFIPNNKGRIFSKEHKMKLSLIKKFYWSGRKKTLDQKKEYYCQYRKNNKNVLREKNKKIKEKDNGLYKTFNCILQRCNNKKQKYYKNYGGRGIKCLWLKYIDFKNDMYKSYLEHYLLHGRKNSTIERIDVNGNYCLENCCWATRVEQNKNKRKL